MLIVRADHTIVSLHRDGDDDDRARAHAWS